MAEEDEIKRDDTKPESPKDQINEDINSKAIVTAIKELSRVIAKNEKDNETVLRENEKKRDEILRKQTDIHSRQLQIVFVTAFLFMLFLFISGVYFKVLVR